MPDVADSTAEKTRNNRRRLIAALVMGALLFGGWWSTRMLRARKAAWLEKVRATGAKAGIEKKDYDDIGEIIAEFTVGDVFIVWVDDPRQIRAILEIPDDRPRHVQFIVACPADDQALMELCEGFPKRLVSHMPYAKSSDLSHPAYADVR